MLLRCVFVSAVGVGSLHAASAALQMKGGIIAAQVKRSPLKPQINLGAVSEGNGWMGQTKIIMFTQMQAARNDG